MNKKTQKNQAVILVVEDDQTISQMLVKVLEEEGYEVMAALDGNTATKQLEKFDPDLVIMDLRIPHRSGLELLADIRKKDHELGIFVPVIVLTGVYTSRDDKVKSLGAGADDFLSKPFDLIELMARVRSLLRVQELYKRAQYLATHDPLTRCYNRRYLMEFLNRENERFKRYKNPFSFLMLDLDHFKKINDEAGHEAGDQVLIQVGFRLQDFFRAVDCVARLGGDEFAVVLPDCNALEGSKVGDRLVNFMNDHQGPNDFPQNLLKKVGISVGIASLPEHTKDTETLIKMADQAMYQAKKKGRNQFCVATA